MASLLKRTATQRCLKKCPRVHALALGASGQTRNVDLQAHAAVQMWNQRASVMVYPLVCESIVSSPRPHYPPPSVAGAAASLLGLACLSLPKQPMINEALNTSSLSSGPGEPPQLNKQAQPLFYPAATILGLRWVDRQPPLPPLAPPAPSAGRNSQDLSELARINESPDISRRSTCVRDPTKSHLGVSERRENIPASPLNMCGTQAHTLAPYGGAVYERNML